MSYYNNGRQLYVPMMNGANRIAVSTGNADLLAEDMIYLKSKDKKSDKSSEYQKNDRI